QVGAAARHVGPEGVGRAAAGLTLEPARSQFGAAARGGEAIPRGGLELDHVVALHRAGGARAQGTERIGIVGAREWPVGSPRVAVPRLGLAADGEVAGPALLRQTAGSLDRLDQRIDRAPEEVLVGLPNLGGARLGRNRVPQVVQA